MAYQGYRGFNNAIDGFNGYEAPQRTMGYEGPESAYILYRVLGPQGHPNPQGVQFSQDLQGPYGLVVPQDRGALHGRHPLPSSQGHPGSMGPLGPQAFQGHPNIQDLGATQSLHDFQVHQVPQGFQGYQNPHAFQCSPIAGAGANDSWYCHCCTIQLYALNCQAYFCPGCGRRLQYAWPSTTKKIAELRDHTRRNLGSTSAFDSATWNQQSSGQRMIALGPNSLLVSPVYPQITNTETRKDTGHSSKPPSFEDGLIGSALDTSSSSQLQGPSFAGGIPQTSRETSSNKVETVKCEFCERLFTGKTANANRKNHEKYICPVLLRSSARSSRNSFQSSPADGPSAAVPPEPLASSSLTQEDVCSHSIATTDPPSSGQEPSQGLPNSIPPVKVEHQSSTTQPGPLQLASFDHVFPTIETNNGTRNPEQTLTWSEFDYSVLPKDVEMQTPVPSIYAAPPDSDQTAVAGSGSRHAKETDANGSPSCHRLPDAGQTTVGGNSHSGQQDVKQEPQVKEEDASSKTASFLAGIPQHH